MENIKRIRHIFALTIAGFLFFSVNSYSQTRKLDDGTIVYNDGTKRLPNGNVIFKGNTYNKNGGDIILPDGSVIYDDGSRRWGKKDKNGKWMPPGQAKKVYGGSAKDYAPGQQKLNKNKHKYKNKSKGKNGKRKSNGNVI